MLLGHAVLLLVGENSLDYTFPLVIGQCSCKVDERVGQLVSHAVSARIRKGDVFVRFVANTAQGADLEPLPLIKFPARNVLNEDIRLLLLRVEKSNLQADLARGKERGLSPVRNHSHLRILRDREHCR
jgi:hypothetical protein